MTDTKTLEQRAVEVRQAALAAAFNRASNEWPMHRVCDELDKRILAFAREVRREALEEAAKALDDHGWVVANSKGEPDRASDVVRTLIEKEPS